MLQTIISKIGISFFSNMLSSVLKSMDNDNARVAGQSLEQVVKQINLGEITPEQISNANKHLKDMAMIDSSSLEEINKSLRAEILSHDPYVRRMRPTFGYIMAFTWAAQMFAVAHIMITDPGNASVIIEAIESLSAIWAVGLSVLGIYVYKRSEEKKRLFPL